MTHFIKIFIVICHGPYGPDSPGHLKLIPLEDLTVYGPYSQWPEFNLVIDNFKGSCDFKEACDWSSRDDFFIKPCKFDKYQWHN